MGANSEVDRRPLRRDAQENYERLLAAAARVFDEHGLEAGVAEIAREAGVGMGTLYRHFPTKDALVQAVIHDVLEATIRMARDAAGKPDGTGLEHFLEASGAFQAERAGCLPRLWDTDHEMVRAARACISGLLADAQRHGRIRSDLTSTDLTMVMFSIRGIVETTSSVAPAAWRRHLDLLIAGMRPSAEVLPHGPLGSGQIDAILSTRIDARRGATRVAN